MKNHITGAGAVLALLLVLAACGQGAASPSEVSMTAADFSPTSVTIKAGQAVHFTDPAGVGATHIVCLGHDGACDSTAPGPQELEGEGFTINLGDPPRGVTFPTPGTYKLTCSIHPSMNLTVIVQ